MDENTTGGEYRKKFADLFKTDYEDLVNKKAFGENPDVKDYDGYVDFLVKQGEFDHKMNQPFKQFISGVLDLTIVKPDNTFKSDINNLVIRLYDGDYSSFYKNLKSYKGEIAAGFGSNGGGMQYELAISVEWLEKLGFLKEIK